MVAVSHIGSGVLAEAPRVKCCYGGNRMHACMGLYTRALHMPPAKCQHMLCPLTSNGLNAHGYLGNPPKSAR